MERRIVLNKKTPLTTNYTFQTARNEMKLPKRRCEYVGLFQSMILNITNFKLTFHIKIKLIEILPSEAFFLNIISVIYNDIVDHAHV